MASFPYPSYLEQKYGSFVDVLGEGDFGEVIQVEKGYAIKIISGETNASLNLPDHSQIVDYSCSNNIIGDYILKNIEVYVDGKYTYLVMPLGNNVPLLPPKNQQFNIFTQMCLGVSDCHRASIAHHDIKINNYVTINNKVKLTDFGLAKIYPEVQSESNRHGVTLYYKSPEDLLLSTNHNVELDMLIKPYRYYSSDVWALGVILLKWQLNMDGNDFPFNGNYAYNMPIFLSQIFDYVGIPNVNDLGWNNIQLFNKAVEQFNKNNTYNGNGLNQTITDPVIKDLLRKMLTIDPRNRITIFDVLKHPYFKSSNLITRINLSKPSLAKTLNARSLVRPNSSLSDNNYSIGVNKINKLYTQFGAENYPIFSCAVALFNILSNYIVIDDILVAAGTSYAIAEMFYSDNRHTIDNFTTNTNLVGVYINYFNTNLNYNLIVNHLYAYAIANNKNINKITMTNILLNPMYKNYTNEQLLSL